MKRKVTDAFERGRDSFLVLSCGHHVLVDEDTPRGYYLDCPRCPEDRSETEGEKPTRIRNGVREFKYRGTWRRG